MPVRCYCSPSGQRRASFSQPEFIAVLPHKFIESRLRTAVAAVLPEASLAAVCVRPCPDPKFGDYQANALMALAKERKLNPRQLASQVVAHLDVSEQCEPVEIAGAGFLNFRLLPAALNATLQTAAAGEHLFFERAAQPLTYVVDFSSPNVAKSMHIGHIRSTILGDALARLLRLLGHRVITDNHIGDWGTQFGKLLVGWKSQLHRAALAADPIGEMERLYKTTHAACEADPATLDLARRELVKLQNGDPENLAIWNEMIQLSKVQFDTMYGRLGVRFDHTYGESFYNPLLKGVVADLRERGIAVESEGAMVVFSEGKIPPKEDPFLKQEDGEWKPNPSLIQKSDGASNYTTTDLATLAFRRETWQPHYVLYVTDGRQQLHFQQLFAIFHRWQPESTMQLKHVWFGSILGEDNKPYKTRSGEVVRLADLLDEAIERAFQVVREKNPDLPEAECRRIARVVGIGAVKYADLLPNRQSDYIFSWDKMLAFNGNTVPYLLYAYARIQSIFRKAAADPTAAPTGHQVAVTAPEEVALARQLLKFDFVLAAVADDYRPNYLCSYLYELAGHFARFFENCPVLKAEPAERASRLLVCELTGRVLRQGLEILGIEVLEQM